VRFTTVTLLLILLCTWVPDDRIPNAFVAGAIAVIVGLAAWHCARTGEWGFAPAALAPSTRTVAAFTFPAILLILGAGAWLGTLHDRRDFLGSLGWLVLWGGAQQWILQTMVLEEARRVAAPRTAILLAATLFAAVHLPNPFLTAVTFAGGLAWCAVYARYPNILPLALSHALGTLAVLYAFDPALTGRLRIGYSYLLLGR
jgi:membrane protease YdiL (CAAX protease family)